MKINDWDQVKNNCDLKIIDKKLKRPCQPSLKNRLQSNTLYLNLILLQAYAFKGKSRINFSI